jgi:AcrR family transcriptional regulator
MSITGAGSAQATIGRMDAEESLRERLVTAGGELLETQGASQLGLRVIARQAGVSHGAPRRYFPTHAALLAAIAARGFDDLTTAFAAYAELPPRARVEQMSLEYVRFATERPEMFTLMFRHDLLQGSGENLRKQTAPIYRQWVDLISACAPNDGEQRALRLWTSMHGAAVLVANRSLELIAPGTDLRRLVTETVDQLLGLAVSGTAK